METQNNSQPWWRMPLVWLVIGLPMTAVVASLATLWIAIRIPDPLVAPDVVSDAVSNAVPAKSLLPAMSGRNHAATPVAGVVPPAPVGSSGSIAPSVLAVPPGR